MKEENKQTSRSIAPLVNDFVARNEFLWKHATNSVDCKRSN